MLAMSCFRILGEALEVPSDGFVQMCPDRLAGPEVWLARTSHD